MRADTDREVARIREQGEQQLAEQRQQVLGELREDIGGLSTELASRILGTSVGQDGPQRATIDHFLTDLDNGDGDGERARPGQTAPQQSGGGAS